MFLSRITYDFEIVCKRMEFSSISAYQRLSYMLIFKLGSAQLHSKLD